MEATEIEVDYEEIKPYPVTVVEDSAADLTPTDIPLEEILADATFNCRGDISPFSIRELAENIERHGLKYPITVQPIINPKFRWRVLAGHRRFHAFQALNRKTIPATIKQVNNESEAIVFNLGENINRQDLNPLQEAETLNKLKNLGHSMFNLAKLVGKSFGWVQDRLRILELPTAIQQDVALGVIPVSEVKKVLQGYSIEQQFEIAKEIKDKKFKKRKKEIDLKEVMLRGYSVARERSKVEVDEMQTLVYNVLGPSFVTRIMAWITGEITDNDIYADIKTEAQLTGKYWMVPDLKEYVES